MRGSSDWRGALATQQRRNAAGACAAQEYCRGGDRPADCYTATRGLARVERNLEFAHQLRVDVRVECEALGERKR